MKFKSSLHLKAFLLGFWSFLFLSATLSASEQVQKPLESTSSMEAETRAVIRYLHRDHYLNETIDQLDLKDFIENFLKDLDSQHMFLTQEEADDLINRFSLSIDVYLKKGNLFPAFKIFETYRDKSVQRFDWIIHRIDSPFNFDQKESFTTDRSKEKWPESHDSADELWEKRLKYELLNKILSEIEKKEAEEEEQIELESEAKQYLDTYENSPNGEEKANLENNAEENFKKQSPLSIELQNSVENTIPSKNIDTAPKPLLTEQEKFNLALNEALIDMKKRYERRKKNFVEFEAADVEDIFLNTLTQMYDPHSTFLSSDALEDFNVSMRNSFVGIGAVLSSKDGYCEIKELLPGGPAEASRELESTDSIIGVAQGNDDFVDVVDMKLRKIVKLIKGKKGTLVRLLIKPGSSSGVTEEKVVNLIRDEIKLTANLAKADIIQVPIQNKTVSIGVINLPSFYSGEDSRNGNSGTTHDVEELIIKLKKRGIKGLILDLRRNGGGILDEAVKLTGLFIPEGPVVQVKNTQGQIRFYEDTDPKITWDGPLMMLVSRYSASASEIVAGALKDHGRALIVGDSSTHGKGTVQAIFPIEHPPFLGSGGKRNRSATKITIRKFYLPKGDSTQIRGVHSDIILPSINEFLPIAESDLPNALEWDRIKPANWGLHSENPSYTNTSSSLVSLLRDKSLERQNGLVEFTHLKRSIDWLKGQRDKKEISLNITERKLQKKEAEIFQEEIDDALDSLKETISFQTEEVLLDIALEQELKSSKIKALATKNKEADDNETDVFFDILLREGVRIMADWLRLEDDAKKPATEHVILKKSKYLLSL